MLISIAVCLAGRLEALILSTPQGKTPEAAPVSTTPPPQPKTLGCGSFAWFQTKGTVLVQKNRPLCLDGLVKKH